MLNGCGAELLPDCFWTPAIETCCRAGGTAAKAEGAPKLFSGLVRASFWPRFWPRSEPVAEILS